MEEQTIAQTVVKVLEEAKQPLTVAEITQVILEKRLYSFNTEDKQGMVRVAIERRCEGGNRKDSVEPKYFEKVFNEKYQLINLINSSKQPFYNQELTDDEVVEDDDSEIYEEDKAPFDPEAVRVTPKPMPIDSVLKRIKRGEIDLAPGFQRQAGIWNNVAQSRLIESIILRIPLPAFYIDATNDDKWSVIDGLQRFTTFKNFVLDQSLRLTGLEYFTSLKDSVFDELPRSYQRRIEETTLNLYLIEKGSPPEVTFNIFKRVNTGGLPLSPQELRHALNYGKAAEFLEELSKIPLFKELVKIPASKIKRMDDREYILGFIAFKLTSYKNYPKNTGRDAFLNAAMKQLNSTDRGSILFADLRHDLERALDASKRIFGEYAFRKISQIAPKRYPVNKALFEVWSVSLSNLTDHEIDILCNHRERLMSNFIRLIDSDEEFARSVSQAANNIAIRFSTVEQLISNTLGG